MSPAPSLDVLAQYRPMSSPSVGKFHERLELFPPKGVLELEPFQVHDQYVRQTPQFHSLHGPDATPALGAVPGVVLVEALGAGQGLEAPAEGDAVGGVRPVGVVEVVLAALVERLGEGRVVGVLGGSSGIRSERRVRSVVLLACQ